MFQWVTPDGTESIKSRAVQWIIDGVWPGKVEIITARCIVISERPDAMEPVTFFLYGS